MTDRIAPNPYSPYANTDPNQRHLIPSFLGAPPNPGVLALTACERMTVVPDGTLGEATDALREGRLDDVPPGLCRSCVLVATATGGADFRQSPQACEECGGQSSQGRWCALCRQELHEKWWAKYADGPQPGDPIAVLGLPARVYNNLKRSEIHTVGVLLGRTEQDILDIRNSGGRTLDEIVAKLAGHGLALKELPAEDGQS